MDELKELYQELIIDHNKNPRNYGELKNATNQAEGFNPLCGDHIYLYLEMYDQKVKDIKFAGSGCAISKASASLMTGFIKGKNKEQALTIFDIFHRLLLGEKIKEDELNLLGKLSVFNGIHDFPARVKCAGLCWHTLKSALNEEKGAICTE